MGSYEGKRAKDPVYENENKMASPDKGGMAAAIDRVDYELEGLGELIEHLNRKLQPILRAPSPMADDAKGSDVDSTNSDIQNVFLRQSERLQHCNDSLRELLHRVDL